MRIARLTCLLAVLLALVGCSSPPTVLPNQTASGGVSSAGGGSSSGGPSGRVSPSRQPVPAPSDSDGLQVSGPVPVSLLSRAVPLDPTGPYLGQNVTDLLGQYRSALGSRQPTCLPAGCWADARVPSGSLLLAVRPASVACYQLTRITTAQSAAAVRIDLQLNYVCRPGAGTAARMAGWLFALPANVRPAGGGLAVTVRVSPKPGTAYTMLGGSASMP
jgi:hypothetical protein